MPRERQRPQNVLTFILLNTFNKENKCKIVTDQPEFRDALLSYMIGNILRKDCPHKLFICDVGDFHLKRIKHIINFQWPDTSLNHFGHKNALFRPNSHREMCSCCKLYGLLICLEQFCDSANFQPRKDHQYKKEAIFCGQNIFNE